MLQKKSVTNALCNSTGVETTACIEGMHMKHGKPTATAVATATDNPRGPGPVASVAERLVVVLKPGNAGGAKGPYFGHVDGRDKGIAIGFGLATQKRTRTSRKRLYGQAKAAPQGVIVGLIVKPVGEPDAGNPPVRFDEREVETEHGMRLLRHRRGNPETEYVEAYPTAPPLDSTPNLPRIRVPVLRVPARMPSPRSEAPLVRVREPRRDGDRLQNRSSGH